VQQATCGYIRHAFREQLKKVNRKY